MAKRADWEGLRRWARHPVDPALELVLRWLALQSPRSGATFEQVARFLRRHPDWPERHTLLRRAELLLDAKMPAAKRLQWFDRHAPRTVTGQTLYLETLRELGMSQRFRDSVRRIWINERFNGRQERAFRLAYGKLLRAEDHWRRLDGLLWKGHTRSARRMFTLADKPHRMLAHARLSLRRMTGNVDAAIRRVPLELRSDPGLKYERLRWRQRKKKLDAARELLWDIPRGVPHAKLWWRARSRQIRHALDKSEFGDAYLLAASHVQDNGAGFAEAEWHAGWIALRYAEKSGEALTAFATMADAVRTPISRARATYWAGRAAKAAGKKRQAKQYFAQAATYPTTFYGQLAGDRLELPPTEFPSAPIIAESDRAAHAERMFTRAVIGLSEIGEAKLARRFLRQAARDADNRESAALIAELARSVGHTDIAVYAARRAATRGEILIEEGYPAPRFRLHHGLERALVLALIRQESGFRADAVSRAGARGLMQLMPATAKQTASSLKIRYSKTRLLTEPSYNLRLGQAYLAQMLEKFDGNYALAIAAYNAGPHRVTAWIKTRGDPRAVTVDQIDWLERIPFGETRNYVQRVLENLVIYRRIMGVKPADRDPFNVWCGGPCGMKLDTSAARPRT